MLAGVGRPVLGLLLGAEDAGCGAQVLEELLSSSARATGTRQGGGAIAAWRCRGRQEVRQGTEARRRVGDQGLGERVGCGLLWRHGCTCSRTELQARAAEGGRRRGRRSRARRHGGSSSEEIGRCAARDMRRRWGSGTGTRVSSPVAALDEGDRENGDRGGWGKRPRAKAPGGAGWKTEEGSDRARVWRGSARPRGRAPAGPWAISKEEKNRRPSRLD